MRVAPKSLTYRLLLLLAARLPLAVVASTTVRELQCDNATDPFGIDDATPRLSWVIESDQRAQRQTAYQILVSSTPERLTQDRGDLWDSDKTASNESHLVPYAGAPLHSNEACWWKIRLWDQGDRVSAWSPPARWTMGLLTAADWRAKWIGFPVASGGGAEPASILLRREFTPRRGLTRAVLHVTGLGQYEVNVNGRKIGDDLLSPGWTNYRKTVLYATVDLTAQLRAGSPNALGLTLGNGMYRVLGGRYTKFTGSFGPQQAIAQLHLNYADGSTEIIGTDRSWQTAPGPITFNDIYGGEDYDARRTPHGWDSPAFDARTWLPAAELPGPGGALRGRSHAAPPLRAHEVLSPVAQTKLPSGAVVYDLGQNASVMARLAVRGPAGAIVRVTPAEVLNQDGSVSRRTVGGGEAWWQYTLAGSGATERWFPQFFYQGARYFQVECSAPAAGGARPVVESLEGVVVHTSSAPAGEFSCSNELFNRIRTLIRWAQRSNLVSVITDCPHRERLGWLEQYHLNGPALRYEFNLDALFAKTFDDMADAQLDNGLVPDIAPEYPVFDGGFRDSPEWGSAIILAAWQHYEFTGDRSVFDRHYEAMQRYLAYLGTQAKDHLLNHGLGDWYDLGPKAPGRAQLTPVSLTATAIYYEDIRALARIAALLGRTADAARYTALRDEVGAAFNRAFYDPAKHTYASGSQTSNALPLVLGLVPSVDRAAVVATLVAAVHARGDAVSSGDVGYRYLLRALADGSRSDVIYQMNNQSEKPGYGYQLAHGATSLTEAWDVSGADNSSSQNHFMLGQITEWFYHDLAGIHSDPAGPGFQKIIIRPAIVGDLTWVKARYASVRGPIVSAWRRDGAHLTLDLTIPANTTATVYLPTSDSASVLESDAPAARAVGVRPLAPIAGQAVFAIGSGHYVFTAAR